VGGLFSRACFAIDLYVLLGKTVKNRFEFLVSGSIKFADNGIGAIVNKSEILR